nr:MAG TPA: hypothetical protein [Bacteriophage sp.]
MPIHSFSKVFLQRNKLVFIKWLCLKSKWFHHTLYR